MKKLTIITITLNDMDNLIKTVNSIIPQMCEDIEYIIIDGGSTDGTIHYLDSLKLERLRIICEKDSGIYNAMNKGLRYAIGEWVLYINSGDVLLDDVVEVLKSIKEDDDCVYGDVILSIEYKGETYYKTEKGKEGFDIDYLKGRMPFSHQAFLCKRSLLVDIGGFDEDFKTAADWDCIIRLKGNNLKFKHINKTISIYDRSGISSKPHPIEKHLIRKKNDLYKGVDYCFVVDCLMAVRWFVITGLLGEYKKKIQIIWQGYDRFLRVNRYQSDTCSEIDNYIKYNERDSYK